MKKEEKQNSKSNITLSIDHNILDEIKKDSVMQNLSLNAKVNAILAKWVSFYRIAEDLECSMIPSKSWASMIDLMDETKLLNILNNEGITTMYSMFIHNNTPLTLNSVIKYCFQEMALWSGMYSTFRQFDNHNHIDLIFEHKYGIKWSKILENAFTNIIRIMLDHTTE